ncbi:MAG: Gldg family protein, partial [Myxococcota bacterium]|nr:Gldg family protein [Myxococcota bacterium]
MAEEHGITSSYGTVILRAGESTQRLESDFGEEALTNALVRVTAGREHLVCFTEGHEELDPDEDFEPSGMGVVVARLEAQNYTVQRTNLLLEGAVPSKCEVVVVADAALDWHPVEIEMLAAYVARGGAVLVLADLHLSPDDPTQAPNLVRDLTRYGITVGDDMIVEPNPNYQMIGLDWTDQLLDARSTDPHAVTSPLKGMLRLRLTRSVEAAPEVPGVRVQEVLFTSELAWAETDFTVAPEATPGSDRLGRVPLMAIAEVIDPATLRVNLPAVLPSPAQAPASLEALLNTDDGTLDEPDSQASDGPGGEEPVEDVAATPESVDAVVDRQPGGKVLVVGDADFSTNAL